MHYPATFGTRSRLRCLGGNGRDSNGIGTLTTKHKHPSLSIDFTNFFFGSIKSHLKYLIYFSHALNIETSCNNAIVECPGSFSSIRNEENDMAVLKFPTGNQ